MGVTRSQWTAEDGNQPSKRSKLADEYEESGAGDGNRSRMTSLEGCDYLVSGQVIPRSAGPLMVRE